MKDSRRTFIAKEGRGYILGVFIAAVAAAICAWYGVSLLLAVCGTIGIYLFRGTERNIPPSPLAVVSPIDGIVTNVQSYKDRYLDRDAIRVVIKPNLFGEYVIRGSIEGKIKNHWVRERGKRAKILAREYSYWIQTDEKDDVVQLLRPRLWLKPIWYIPVGQRVGQGQRCGFLSLGGRVAVLVPANSKVKVTVGDRVQSGSEILAELTHE